MKSGLFVPPTWQLVAGIVIGVVLIALLHAWGIW